MQSIILAVYDLIISFYKPEEKPIDKSVEPQVPKGYWSLYFKCWLCRGTTEFACKNSIKNKRFKIDCCRCGVENLVIVKKKKNDD